MLYVQERQVDTLELLEEVVVPIDIIVTMSNGFVETVQASKHWSLAGV